MKLQQKIFGIGLLTAVIVPHLYEKGYIFFYHNLAQSLLTMGFRRVVTPPAKLLAVAVN
jgi:hypothetical protein